MKKQRPETKTNSAGPVIWVVSPLIDDKARHGGNAGKVVITTENGEREICVVHDEAHARVIAEAPQLLAALKALHAAVVHGGDVAFSWPNVYAGYLIEKTEGGS